MYLAVLNASIRLDIQHCTLEVTQLRKDTKLFSLQVVMFTCRRASRMFETPALGQKLQDKASSSFFWWGIPLPFCVPSRH